MCTSGRINNIAKESNFSNNVTGKMECGWLYGEVDGEHNVIGMVKIFKIFAKHIAFFLELSHLTELIYSQVRISNINNNE